MEQILGIDWIYWLAPLVFLGAGTIKGAIGIGLPTTVISILSQFVDPRIAIALGHDLWIKEPERQFFYLPFEHSEAMADQNTCLRLMGQRMPRSARASLPWAVIHRDIIDLHAGYGAGRQLGRTTGRT